MRSPRIQLPVLVALAAAIRLAAYAIGPVQRADVRLLEAAELPWGAPYRLANTTISLFDPFPYVLLVAVVVGAAWIAGRRVHAIAAVVLMLGASATTQVLKRLLSAPRPQARGTWLPPDAWPSGHTTAAAALAIAIVLVTPPGRRRAVAVVAALGTLLVGAALVALASHYPSDVLGGLCVAGAWGAATWHVVSRRARRARS